MDFDDKKLFKNKKINVYDDMIGRLTIPPIMLKALGIKEKGTYKLVMVCDTEKKQLLMDFTNPSASAVAKVRTPSNQSAEASG